MIIFLDACAIIYWVELAEPQYSQFADHLHILRQKYRNQTIKFSASYLSLLECRVKPMREKNEKLLSYYQNFFCSSDLSLIEISPSIIEDATQLRAYHNVRTPDAIQAATAFSIKDEVIFITADQAFKKIPKLNVLLI